MHILIVYAHPEPASFNGAMKDQALATLTAAGHEVVVSDLYAMNWLAAVGPGDFLSRANASYLHIQSEQAHAWTTRSFEPQLAGEIDKLLATDLVIFQFPLWWWSIPAILKGYFDRAFGYGFAYGRNGHALAGKKALCCLTTGGPSPAFVPGERETIMELLRPVHKGVFHFCDMDVLPPFVAYGAAKLNEHDRRKYLVQLDLYLRQIETIPPLTF